MQNNKNNNNDNNSDANINDFYYTVSHKNMPQYSDDNISQILTDFQNSFTAGKSVKFATKHYVTTTHHT